MALPGTPTVRLITIVSAITACGLLLGGALLFVRHHTLRSEDLWADPITRATIARLDLASVIASPPADTLDPRTTGRLWHDLLAGELGDQSVYTPGALARDSVWTPSVRSARRELFPGTRVDWLRAARAGAWSEAQREWVTAMPFVSGYGQLISVARAADMDLLSARYRTDARIARMTPELTLDHLDDLLDAMALTAGYQVSMGQATGALQTLADGVHAMAHWARRTPDTREARMALTRYDEFLQGYFEAALAVDRAAGERLQAHGDSLAANVASEGAWRLDEVHVRPVMVDMFALHYFQYDVWRYLRDCTRRSPGPAPRLPGIEQWPEDWREVMDGPRSCWRAPTAWRALR
jgi:hypothetical protein